MPPPLLVTPGANLNVVDRSAIGSLYLVRVVCTPSLVITSSAALRKTFRWKKSPRLGISSSFLRSISLYKGIFISCLHRLCLCLRPLKPERPRCVLLGVLLIALHAALVGLLEEAVHYFVQLFAVLKAPGPLQVQLLPELEPGHLPRHLPGLNNLARLLLRKAGDLANDAVVVEQLAKKTPQLLPRCDALLVLIELLAEESLDLVFLPLIEAVLSISSAELVLVFLLLRGDRNAHVASSLVEVATCLLFPSQLLLFAQADSSDLFVEVLLPLAELLMDTFSNLGFVFGLLSFKESLSLDALFNSDRVSIQ